MKPLGLTAVLSYNQLVWLSWQVACMSRNNDKKFTGRAANWLKILVLFLDDIGALVLIALILWFLRVRIPLPLIIVLIVVVGTVVLLTNLAIIPTLRQRPVTGAEGMIGERGRVVEPLAPEGTILVEGEHWRAKSIEGHIGAGEAVEVVSVDGLTLKVKKVKSET